MDQQRRHLAKSLRKIRAELESLDLWETRSPPAAHLASTEPFCVDTLDFTQWLQWVFIPKMHTLLDNNAALPQQSSIHVLAEEALKDMEQDTAGLIDEIRTFDHLLSGE